MVQLKVVETSLPTSSSLPRHHSQYSRESNEHYTSCRRVQLWIRRALPTTSNLGMAKLVLVVFVFCVSIKVLLVDVVRHDNNTLVIRHGNNEVLYTRHVDGKHCEHMHLHHLEGDFYNPTDCFSRADIQQIILGLVWALADTFERNDIPYWIDSGTLLGAYREKTVIPHDNDGDVGIDEATYLKLRDTDLKLDFPSVYELQVFEAKYRKHGNRDAGIPSRLVHTKSGMYVDIFVFLESKTAASDYEPMFGPIPSGCFGGCKHCPQVEPGKREFKIPKSWVFPLQQCWFGGRMVSCPAQPEKYLEHLYGPNYMTPE